MADDYLLPEERSLHAEITERTRLIETLESERDKLQEKLEYAGSLRGLLFESGRQLETSVLEALSLMGFEANQFRDSESEFDAVLVSEEGRFLGEAEGRDARAINIDKLSQLERNLQEDFARDEVTAYAKGVLFGNSHRLSPPNERPAAFTEKCVAGAKRLGVALVRTADMFLPAAYLKANDDPAYAQACRRAILDASGEVVDFPQPPAA